MHRYQQCTGRLQNDAICFALQNGDTVDPINGNSNCPNCLADVANMTLVLTSQVSTVTPAAHPRSVGSEPVPHSGLGPVMVVGTRRKGGGPAPPRSPPRVGAGQTASALTS